MFEDKENSLSISNRQATACSVAPSKSSFGRLLKEATNEILIESDEKIAMDNQVREASRLAASWMQEEKDRQAASRLNQQLAEEDKAHRMRELEMGEKAALHAAMEERRRVIAEAKEQKDREAKDAEFAKKCVIDDVEERAQIEELCQGDAALAERVAALLQDELLAEEIQRREQAADQRIRLQRAELEKADLELAQREQDLLQRQAELEAAKQAEDDAMAARMLQEINDQKEEMARKRQELADFAVAQRMTIMNQRQVHRQQRKAELISSGTKFRLNNHAAVVYQWESCEADCEDVAGGICLTMFLPELRDVKITMPKKNTVDICAYRALTGSEKASSRGVAFEAEFCIQGKSGDLKEEDIQFEYSSEVGLLFVYIEKVQLAAEDSVPAMKQETSRGSLVRAVKAGLRGFSRMFSSGKESKK